MSYHFWDFWKVYRVKIFFFFLEILYLFWRAVAPKLIKIGIVWYFSMKVEVMNFNRWFMHFSAQTIFSMWKMSLKKKVAFDRTYPVTGLTPGDPIAISFGLSYRLAMVRSATFQDLKNTFGPKIDFLSRSRG